MYLKHAAPCDGIYAFHTDCSYVKDSWARGEYALTNGWVVNAGLWKQVCALANDVGLDNIYVCKVKAHRKLTPAIVGYDRQCLKGNVYADVGAKRGVKMHPGSDDQLQKFKKVRSAYVAVVQFMAKSCVRRLAKMEPRPKLDRIVCRKSPGRGLASWDPSMHAPFIHPATGRWHCQVCLRSSVLPMSGLCAGALPVGRRHTLWTLGTFTFCRKCGAYTSEKVRYLSFQCGVSTRSMVFSLSRLTAGLHPAFGTHIGQPRPLGWLPLPAILDPTPLRDEGEIDGC